MRSAKDLQNLLLGGVVVASLMIATIPASAQVTLDLGEKSIYELQDLNRIASHDPVTQGDLFVTSGKFTGGLWGSFGAGGFADELDLDAFWNTNAGPVKLQFSAQDYFLNGKGGIWDFNNNLVEVYADGYLPFTPTSQLTVGPVLRVLQQTGVRNFANHSLVQPGLRGTWTPTTNVAIDMDVRDSLEPLVHRSNWRWNTGVNYAFNPKTSIRFGFDGMDRANVFDVNLKYHF